MKVSIAIPTYECHGIGWLYISELLNSIYKQSYKNFEVIISDQSTDKKTKELVKYYSKHMDIKYLDSTKLERKIGVNMNNAIKHCSGDIIKTMCADDFFVADNALERIVNSFASCENKWMVVGTVHCHSIHVLHTRMIPYYHDKIHLGANTISSPSVLAMRVKEYLDENLSLLIDCEHFKRLYVKYGEPFIIQDVLMCNRIHDKQMQHGDSSRMEKEKAYCASLYGE